MNYDDVKAHLDRRPFVAITVHTSDGDLLPVKSPEFAFLHPMKRLLYIAADKVAVPIDRFVDLDAITQISTEDGMEMMRKIG